MPWIKIEDGDDGSLSSSGPAAFFFDTLAAKLNFTYTFVRPPDGEWGRSTPNGSFTGMIGMCQRKEIDVALGPFSITYGRSQVADFSLSLYADQIGIFLPRPRRETDISGIAKPLAWQVWTALAVTLGISMVLALISNFLMKRQSLAKTEVSNRLFSIIEISSLIKILLTEAVESLPVATPSRIFLAAWLLGGFILQASYSGVLTSLLAVPKVTVPVDSLEDLVNYGKIPWAIEKGTTLHSSFMQAKSGLYKAINDHGILAPNLYKARHWVKEEKVAVISNSISMRKVISEDYTLTGKCNFYVAKESIISVSLAFAFPKRSPLIQHFDKWLGRLKGSGIISHTMLGISTNISACSVKPGREGGHDTLRFSMMDMAGTFLLYFVGAALGCVALLLEVITKKHWTWKSTR